RVELSGRGRPAVSTKPRHPVTCDRADHPVSRDFADSGVAGIGNQEITGAVHNQTPRTVELSGGGRPAVPAEALYSHTRNHSQNAVPGDAVNSARRTADIKPSSAI